MSEPSPVAGGRDVVPPMPRLVDERDLPRIPRQERSRAKRDALLAAALSLFGEGGYEAVGVEEIVARAGTGVGTFYAYFRSKQQLLLVLMQRYLDVMLALNLLEFPPASEPLETITWMLRRALEPDRAYAGLWRAWREVVLTTPSLAALDAQIGRWMREYVVLLIERIGSSPGLRPDLDVVATASVINAIAWQLSQGPTAPEDSVVRAAARMIYHALFADDPAR